LCPAQFYMWFRTEPTSLMIGNNNAPRIARPERSSAGNCPRWESGRRPALLHRAAVAGDMAAIERRNRKQVKDAKREVELEADGSEQI